MKKNAFVKLCLLLVGVCFFTSALAAPERILKREDQVDAFKAMDLLRGEPVIVSPYLGERSQFDGSNLIINISPINQGLRILQQQQKLENAYVAQGKSMPKGPLVDLSGRVEAFATVGWPYLGRTVGDMNIASAEFDIVADINTWVAAYMTVVFDSGPPAVGVVTQRASNSNLFMDKAFFIIGNLNKSGLYFTAGQLYFPFGQHSSNMLDAPLNIIVFRTKGRGAILGYQQPGDNAFNFAIFNFIGDNNANGTYQFGANVNYAFNTSMASGQIGVGAISNVADANGMQVTGGAPFGGFGSGALARVTPPATGYRNSLAYRVPGVDVQGKLSIGAVNFIAEYMAAVRRFSPADLTFRGRGARPQAYNVEAGIGFDMLSMPTIFALGYSQSFDAQALNIPCQRMMIILSTSIWRYTIQSIQVQHDINYIGSTVSTAARPTGGKGRPGVANPRTLSKSATTVKLQMSAYF